LISGDLLQATAGVFGEMPHTATADVSTSRASIRKVAELSFEAILPGHNPPYVFGARDRVRELVARLE
jgi:glyoxylase-like metal-dependent hydrolase (beta-lactamase superfamily II)